MKRELIDELFCKFEIARHTVDFFEFWSARELQENLGYSEWRNFLNVIEKAKLACQNSGGVITDHFVSILRQVDLGKGGRGVRPEALPPSEDVKKISRYLDSEDKKVLKDGKKKVVKKKGNSTPRRAGGMAAGSIK
jgi:DNA-damage-inducible protein D